MGTFDMCELWERMHPMPEILAMHFAHVGHSACRTSRSPFVSTSCSYIYTHACQTQLVLKFASLSTARPFESAKVRVHRHIMVFEIHRRQHSCIPL